MPPWNEEVDSSRGWRSQGAPHAHHDVAKAIHVTAVGGLIGRICSIQLWKKIRIWISILEIKLCIEQQVNAI